MGVAVLFKRKALEEEEEAKMGVALLMFYTRSSISLNVY
jgi:hypothetical protein